MGYSGDSLGDAVAAMKPATARAARQMADSGGAYQTQVAIQNTPIYTGDLRDSLNQKIVVRLVMPNGVVAYESGVWTDLEYACLLGPTPVTTESGIKHISHVKAGERVLTQTGEWREVLAKTSFPAVEKPDLLDLEVAWRKGRSHRLTLTLDHKVLVRRGPRNLWVQAGDLRGDDLLYHRRKAAHNAGTGRVKECEECGTRHRGQGARYCSVRCRDTAWAGSVNPCLGSKRSEETRRLLSQRNRERGAGVRLNRALGQRGYRTRHERDVEEWLVERGVEYDVQVPVGDHVVDFYLPATGEIIEADGAYWHQDQAKDLARDAAILAAAPGVHVTHLHFYEPRFSPPLDPEPLPGVRYVVCNPGPHSFVDPEGMEAVPILGRREWRYGDSKAKAHGKWGAHLYDLTVEGVHSFLAGGVIVSNSWVERGTGLYGPYKQRITPKTASVLSWVDPRTGRRVFAKSTKGMRGSHMVAIAVAMSEANFGLIVERTLSAWRFEAEAAFGRGRA